MTPKPGTQPRKVSFGEMAETISPEAGAELLTRNERIAHECMIEYQAHYYWKSQYESMRVIVNQAYEALEKLQAENKQLLERLNEVV